VWHSKRSSVFSEKCICIGPKFYILYVRNLEEGEKIIGVLFLLLED